MRENPEETSSDRDPLFLGADAPPLEGERLCVCGTPEGEHLADGSCPEPRRPAWLDEEPRHQFEPDPGEETTRPDIQVEYDAGVAPIGGGR